MNTKKQKGFTLVELLVVIAIIAILVTLILVALGVARAKARDSERKTDIRAIQNALELAASEESGKYPDNLASLVTNKFIEDNAIVDPESGDNYGYKISGDKLSYAVCAELERGTPATYTVGDTTLGCDPTP